MAPPAGISMAARLATSVNEKQEITMVRMKLPRVVSAYRPLSSFLSENAIAWTRKSREPHVEAMDEKTLSTESALSTSHGNTSDDPTDCANGFTRRPSA